MGDTLPPLISRVKTGCTGAGIATAGRSSSLTGRPIHAPKPTGIATPRFLARNLLQHRLLECCVLYMTKATAQKVAIRTKATTTMSPVRRESSLASPVPEASAWELGKTLVANTLDGAMEDIPGEIFDGTVGWSVAAGVVAGVGPAWAVTDAAPAAATTVTDTAFDADSVKPGVSGWVSRSDKSDCWKRICNAGPTV